MRKAKKMRYWKMIRLSSTFIVISLALVGCAISDELPVEDSFDDLAEVQLQAEKASTAEEAGDAGGGPGDEFSVEEEVDTRDLHCGDVETFSTWIFAKTTLRFVNYDSSGATRIDAAFQAGAAAEERVEVHNQTVEKSRNFGGFPVRVTYLGYRDAAGNDHTCNSTDPNAPVLQVSAR